MNATAEIAENDDPALLARCLRGEREAFNGLVTRYQGLVCAQAYSICGDFSRSEDVAQEAFVAAWRQLPTLRDPSRFRAWLCGIARNLALAVAARRQREQPVAPPAVEASTSDTPHALLVTREEESIVWHTLEKLPEGYREVLILFYREQQSVFQVAALLGLSEDAVKQRLSRGRALLKQGVASTVESTLARTRPGPSFTLGVASALLATTSATTSTASAAASLAKGGSALKLFLSSLCGLGGLLGGAFGCFGAWFGVKISAESAPYERQRSAILRMGRRIGLCVALFIVLEFAVAFAVGALFHDSRAIIFSVAGLVTGYLLWLGRIIREGNAELRQIAAEEAAAGTPRREGSVFWQKFGFFHEFELKSRHTLLGWPLWHLQWGHDDGKTRRSSPRAWIAVGDRPIGFLALGAVARGVFAYGGVAIGLVSIGGVSIGAVALGGCALAIYGYGGVVLGWVVQGGFSVGWRLAMGGFALAKEFGLGGEVVAAHANDAAAQATAQSSLWLHLTSQWWFPLVAPATAVLFLIPGPLMAAIRRKERKGLPGAGKRPTDD
jgi:RNA polymerase sigma factor (sigma-70 family)